MVPEHPQSRRNRTQLRGPVMNGMDIIHFRALSFTGGSIAFKYLIPHPCEFGCKAISLLFCILRVLNSGILIHGIAYMFLDELRE